MFDDGMKITVFAVGALAFVLSMAGDAFAPHAGVATEVDIAGLPPVPVSAAPGGLPAQTRVAATRVPLGQGFEAELLYGYALEGLVVTRREFRTDATSAVSPLDLGIVWGPLAEPGRAEAISFRAVPRAVRFMPEPGADLPEGWHDQVTNNHLIPADQRLHEALMAIEVGDRVRLRGYLVVVTGETIRPWRSSTRRNDSTIIGGCEIILVTSVEALPPEGEAA